MWVHQHNFFVHLLNISITFHNSEGTSAALLFIDFGQVSRNFDGQIAANLYILPKSIFCICSKHT